MQYRTFKKINEKTSLLGMGCMRLPVDSNDTVKEEETIRIIRDAIDGGVNYVDTAFMYHNGQSEKILGKALKDGYREKILLAENLRNGHAQDALFDHLAVSGELTGLQRFVEVHVEIDALLLEHVREQHFRVEARRFDTLVLEVLLRPLQDAADGPDLVVHSAFTFFNRSA